MSSFIRLAATAAVLAMETARAIKALSNPTASEKRRVFRDHHLWQSYSASTGEPVRLPVDYCFHCRVDRTRINELEPCFGPPGWK